MCLGRAQSCTHLGCRSASSRMQHLHTPAHKHTSSPTPLPPLPGSHSHKCRGRRKEMGSRPRPPRCWSTLCLVHRSQAQSTPHHKHTVAHPRMQHAVHTPCHCRRPPHTASPERAVKPSLEEKGWRERGVGWGEENLRGRQAGRKPKNQRKRNKDESNQTDVCVSVCGHMCTRVGT